MPMMTTTEFNLLPPEMQGAYRNLERGAQQHTGAHSHLGGPEGKTEIKGASPFGVKAPTYPGQRLAPIPDDIRHSHEIGRAVEGIYEPYLRESQSRLREASRGFPSRVNEYMNPYQQHVIDKIAHEGNRNFKENVLPALEGKFLRLGQHGGSRHAKMAQRAARDLQHEIMERQAQAMATGYQQAGQRYSADQVMAIEAAKETGNLGALMQAGRFSDMTALENQGRYQQQQEQASRDLSYQDFLRQQEYPFQMMNFYQNMLHGMPAQGVHTQFQHTPATPQMNVLGQIGPLAASLYGMRNMMNR